jgi:hypothetical protein
MTMAKKASAKKTGGTGGRDKKGDKSGGGKADKGGGVRGSKK